jgi:hypothetical protein
VHGSGLVVRGSYQPHKVNIMIKPSYEAQLEKLQGLYEDAHRDWKTATAELARVRGLLQRAKRQFWDYSEATDGRGNASVEYLKMCELLGMAPNDPDVPSGAESADIGKLDAAACICLPDADDFDKNCPKHGYVARFNAKGSAETESPPKKK